MPKKGFKKIQTARFVIQSGFVFLATWAILKFWGAGGSHQVCPFSTIEAPLLALKHSFDLNFFLIGISIGVFFIALSAILPRLFCGWVCPVGFVSRLLRYIGKAIGIRTYISVKQNIAFGWFAFAVLFYIMIGTFVSGRIWCVGGCPFFWGYAASAIPMPSLTIVLISIFIFGSIVVERFFCRWFCPYGAILGLVTRISVFAIHQLPGSCARCAPCADCSMGVLPQDSQVVCGPLCISCFKCTETCTKRTMKMDRRKSCAIKREPAGRK
jgi:polyferredoxin